MLNNVRADVQRARQVQGVDRWTILFDPGVVAVVTYRLCRWAFTLRIRVARQIVFSAARIPWYLVRILTGVYISPAAEIGPGLVVHTWSGVFIPPVKIGRDCVVQHGVVLRHGVRGVGDDVYFGAGAKVMAPVWIGNNVAIAANSLVLTDIPDNVTVIGVPARMRFRRRPRAPSSMARADGHRRAWRG